MCQKVFIEIIFHTRADIYDVVHHLFDVSVTEAHLPKNTTDPVNLLQFALFICLLSVSFAVFDVVCKYA